MNGCAVFHCRSGPPMFFGVLLIGTQAVAGICARHGEMLGDRCKHGWQVDPEKSAGWRLVQNLSRPDRVVVVPPTVMYPPSALALPEPSRAG